MTENFDLPEGNDVYWEKWVDVYEEEINELKDIEKELMSREFEDEPMAYAPEEEQALAFPAIRTIMTPFGILPLTEQSLASKYFKFWVGHSNFKLLKSYVDTIESTKGVETVDVLTPYRFRISIGKLFKDRTVMAEVRNRLLNSL
tara:strand:- start:64021 stop:64455 length:435 start_codon:yes stop_codon:yes gene_type:complete